MSYHIRWRNKALHSLQDVRDYLVEHNPQAAKRMLIRIVEATKLIAFMPEIFPKRGKYRLCTSVSPYLIYYSVNNEEKSVMILDIVHASRNIKPDEVKAQL